MTHDGLSEGERLGLWLADNNHEILMSARCQKGDGRVLAKVCDVAGLRFIWFAGLRITKTALIEDELEELRMLPTAGGEPRPQEIDELIADVRAGSAIQAPPQAFPAVFVNGTPLEETPDARAVLNCPGCRTRYRVRYDGRAFDVSPAPKDPML